MQPGVDGGPVPAFLFGELGLPDRVQGRNLGVAQRCPPLGPIDRDGIPDRYDRDKNGDGVPDKWQRRRY